MPVMQRRCPVCLHLVKGKGKYRLFCCGACKQRFYRLTKNLLRVRRAAGRGPSPRTSK